MPGRRGTWSLWLRCRQLRDLALQRGDVAFLARDRRFQVGHPVEILLKVTGLGALAVGRAVLVLSLQLGEAVLLALQFGLEDAPGVAVARALVGRIDLGRRIRRA